ncbi:MAG: valine--tRNA ligase [Patescibacteria group bacterium]|nr:valine--tRNA ligase [Patescibacteria group bacterium]MDE2438009.1 valine--tRNA ligase [Patescibacteria group bacterium]
MEHEFEKSYDARHYESDVYARWEQSGLFNPDNLPSRDRTPYCIIMPPPNVTGTLHLGHALGVTIQDILIRFKRMQGFKTLWLPGTDHAAIATQSKVEKLLEKEEGKRKHDLPRDEFLKRVETFAKQSHDTIVSQLRSMGASCDWSREAFTLDNTRNFAVRTAFKRMYDDGLIYRKNRVVNWDVKGQTTISDDEVVYVEREAKLYTFRYSKDFPISISTTRPETKIGDTAVAVHPDDPRYQEFVGKTYSFTFCGVPVNVTIIADKSVEKDFGTGALGVTPAHSMIDAEIAERHNLPSVQVIDERGKIMVGDERIKEKKATEARETIVTWLKDEGLLEKEETITQNVATAERTGGIIEPLPKLQWFVDVNKEFAFPHAKSDLLPQGTKTTLKKLMELAVGPNHTAIIPEHFTKIYRHWIHNLRDWCISRQIWYGHRIPVWYRGEEIYCDITPPEGEGWKQDSDTLDTWFSSGLWTCSTLGWPDKRAKDFLTYHPTDVLETGYDILFFWIARMILMTTYLTGQIPFKTVLLHGIVRDAQKQKMSKSKGNMVDPLEMIEQYGTDALRFALIFNTAPGTDSALAEDKIRGMKHFANKLWNIARFVCARNHAPRPLMYAPYGNTEADATILQTLKETVVNVTRDLEAFQLHEAAQKLYQFTWHDFADVYIEASKAQRADATQQENTDTILLYCLLTILKLLHPFMPFVTEVLYQQLPFSEKQTTLMIEQWPVVET